MSSINSEEEKPLVDIKIVSDKAALKEAKNEYKFNITWHPFFLNSQIPEEGVNRQAYFKEKFGIDDETKSPMFDRLNQVGKDVGINFKRGDVVPNTFKSHQLIKYAKEIGKQNEIIGDIFSTYFEQGKNIGKEEVLKEIGDKYEITDYKKIFDDKDSVNEEANTFRYSYGISGVPYFIFGNKYAFSGAQPAEMFLKVFKKFKL
eukprot:gene3958-7214_t